MLFAIRFSLFAGWEEVSISKARLIRKKERRQARSSA
jgi:hypothetical protein